MSKLSFRARALDASKPMPIYLAEELPDLPDYSAINRAVPQMPSGMEKEEECEHHLQRAICTGLIIPTPEVCEVNDHEFYERCYPPDYKMPKQHIHMQPLWQEQEAPEYDIDSEDERWLKQQRHPELTELKFEQMMDKLEKCSGQTVVTLNEAKLLLERHDDLVIAVYDYWLNKRLKTQHPLVLSVKTENRPGQSSNNPYLAFRRRTEKMQTRKNRKNDESSYEKMLKLRRDLARALTLLELVARRERAKRDLVRLTALLAERRLAAGDFAHHVVPDLPTRPQYAAVPLPSAGAFRRDAFPHHYTPRPPPAPLDQPRQREKRPYKRRKHRHHATGSVQGLRDSGVYTSSEEEGGGGRAEAGTPPDDGPFAFRRKPGCYYEMPTSTLCGDPVDPENTSKEALFEHEFDERHRFTLASVARPVARCVGFARRRVGRGGRVLLDRAATPLDDLWPRLDFRSARAHRRRRRQEMELETKLHRSPKEISRDYHSGGKHPWRHAFRQHLARNPHLWIADAKDAKDTSVEVKHDAGNIKPEPMDVDALPTSVKSDISVSARTIDSVVVENLGRVMRKRSWSGCSDSSYDSDESLQPVEKEFEKFIDEVNKKWLHFRPKTPPPSPPYLEKPSDDQLAINLDTPISVELRAAERPPSGTLDTFTTAEFTLGGLFGDLASQTQDPDNSGGSLDISGDDLLTENFTGLTDAQVESILSETDLKALADVDLTRDDKKMALPDDLLDELVKDVDTKDSFLLHGQSSVDGRAGSGPRRNRSRSAEAFGSSAVHVSAAREPVYVERAPPPAPPPPPPAAPRRAPAATTAASAATNTTNTTTTLEEASEPHPRPDRKRNEDTIHEIQLPHGVQLKTVQTKHSPLKKHIITSVAHRRGDVALVTAQDAAVSSAAVAGATATVTATSAAQPQIVTVAVSESLKLRLQNHLLSSQAGGSAVVGLVQNGPFAGAVAVPVQHAARDAAGVASVASVSAAAGAGAGAAVVSVAGAGAVSAASPRRVPAPLVHLAPASLAHKQVQLAQHAPVVVAPSHTIHHVASNKLKVLHAHPLTQSQRSQLLAQSRAAGLTQLPAVVSLAALGDAKAAGAAALLKAPGSVAQFFEIKGGQLAKGPHLVNVVRQPQPGKPPTVARLDLNDAKKRQVLATFEGAALKGNVTAGARPQRVSVSLDGRHLVRAALPAGVASVAGVTGVASVAGVAGAAGAAGVRAPHVRHQIQLKNRTLQVSAAPAHSAAGSISIPPSKTTSLPSSVVANLLQKNVPLPKGGQKIAISGPGGQPLSANVQAIAFTSAQLKARQARLIAQPRPAPLAEIVEATTAPVATSSSSGNMSSETPLEGVGTEGEEAATNGAVRRRTADTLPMEVT